RGAHESRYKKTNNWRRRMWEEHLAADTHTSKLADLSSDCERRAEPVVLKPWLQRLKGWCGRLRDQSVHACRRRAFRDPAHHVKEQSRFVFGLPWRRVEENHNELLVSVPCEDVAESLREPQHVLTDSLVQNDDDARSVRLEYAKHLIAKRLR